ncbi:MAG: alpha/beta fold hydrolase, partial [Phenylobacterium sp.]
MGMVPTMKRRKSSAILHAEPGVTQPRGRRLMAPLVAAFLLWPGAAALAQSPCSGVAPGADRPVRNLSYLPPTPDLPRSVHLLDLWPGASPTPAPLVVFVHGGTWMHGGKYAGTSGQARAFRKAGYAYATVNYRLLRHGPPQEAARDIAEAVAYLRREAKGCGLDPDRIILMGHSAGAHLAALVALDESYLESAGAPPESIRAAVLLDAYGLDIARHVRETGDRVYARVFGPDPAGWTA